MTVAAVDPSAIPIRAAPIKTWIVTAASFFLRVRRMAEHIELGVE
jgi:hypothetical protein